MSESLKHVFLQKLYGIKMIKSSPKKLIWTISMLFSMFEGNFYVLKTLSWILGQWDKKINLQNL